MSSRPLTTALAAAAALTVAASPASAQQSSVAGASATVQHALDTGKTGRVVASYDFQNAPRDLAFPRSVTVADSAGALLASVSVADGVRTIPMTVTIIERSLVLQGLTDDGVLTLVLDRQNEGGQTTLASGSWTLGARQGQLRARPR